MSPVGDERRRSNRTHEIATDEAGDWSAIVRRDRHRHAHAPVWHVPLPAHPEEREAAPHERTVSKVLSGCWVCRSTRLLEGLENSLAATVPRFVEESTVTAARIHRLQEVEVSAELDFAAHVSRCELQVDNDVVFGQVGIELEMSDAHELLVRSSEAKRSAVEDDLAPLDFESY